MPATVVVGCQWGDEGKGRVADWFAAQSDIIARYAGGDNAGHTVAVGDQTFKLHLVPSGVLHQNARCVLGRGMVINPIRLMEELKGLDERGIDISPERIHISRAAHLIMPGHIALDGAKEASRGSGAIGTTKRGIGPAYTSKVSRSGIRAESMQDVEAFVETVEEHTEQTNSTLSSMFGLDPIDSRPEDVAEAAAFLAPYLEDVSLLLHQALQTNQQVLCEGAQGTLLDLDHGGYPFVTSSSPTVGGAMTGLGIGPKHIERVVGVAKSFTTRVGAGPFPTELTDEFGDRLRGTGENPWDEFGTTTGRPRRTGWLDTVILRYSARINGLTDLILTKLDVLSGFTELHIADGYEHNGDSIAHMPTSLDVFSAVKPVYHPVDGWRADIMDIREFDALPEQAQRYVRRVEELVNVPVSQVTVGPEREQVIHLDFS